MVKIFIDENELEVEEGMTVLEAAESAGLKIPHLCYHKAFIPQGSCRICLVEIEGLPKLELACSTRVREGMKVSTQNERVVDARKGVLECLLAEHPIDCPICDKAGDCKLQDYYEEYGLFDSEFKEQKEKREKKIEIGKNLLLDQERCVLCRRCVRFLKEVTKTEELGVFERGIHTEINVYEGVSIDNNYSGNLAEICPVGAITDRDFRFKTRSWFLKSEASICPLCSRGCNIFIESHQGFSRFSLPKRVYRVRARENEKINGFWICDVGRYGYSYVDEHRMDKILIKNSTKSQTWSDWIPLLAEKIKRLYHMKRSDRMGLILHTWLTNEELYLIDRLFRKDLGIEKVCFIDPPPGAADEFLLTAERTPNSRGAQELGFDLQSSDGEDFFEKLELLLVFGSPLFNKSNIAVLQSALYHIETKILFASHEHEIHSLFDVVLPVSLIPEKEGSLTNADGIVQAFSSALESPGDCQAEWKSLVQLAKELKINSKFYARFRSPKIIREELEREIPFFEKNSE
jgi:NADH-quinone oxidoreductase subunit G